MIKKLLGILIMFVGYTIAGAIACGIFIPICPIPAIVTIIYYAITKVTNENALIQIYILTSFIMGAILSIIELGFRREFYR